MATTERILFGTYVLCGPVAWLLVAYFVAIGRERMNKLTRGRDVLPTNPPLVSILIPAKDEGVHIRDCLTDVLKQDYPTFEVIAIDDRSADDTGAILDDVASLHANSTRSDRFHAGSSGAGSDPAGVGVSRASVRVVHIEVLPEGWLGKCHALDAGARHARGDWLFFVDSDVRLSPDALTRMAAVAVAREYDALSILTTIETHTFMEKLMLPLLAGTWMTMFSGDQTNEDSEPDKALANGQAFLIRRSAYEKVGGHAAVKDRIVEDVELMRTLKKAGHRCRFLAGRELAATRMHTSWSQLFNGWARIFAGTARGRVWPMGLAIIFLIASVMTFLPALAAGFTFRVLSFSMTSSSGAIMSDAYYGLRPAAAYWLMAAVIHWLLMTVVSGFVWVWSGNRPRYALLLPVSVPIAIAVLLYAIRKAFSGKIDWRGSAVDVRQTSRTSTPVPSPGTPGEG